MADLRLAAVAGTFYPRAPTELAAAVRACFDDATAHAHAAEALPAGSRSFDGAPGARPAASRPKALIVPHAGYVYSGAIAAAAYARLADGREPIRRVVLFGPTHRVPVRGLAVPTANAFATPLGNVGVDRTAVELALALPQVRASDAAHALEHSLEVQLPFLQAVLGDFEIVPFAVGEATPGEVAEVMELLWGGPETLLVVSSDLSHYHPYATAQALDRATAAAILSLSANLDHEQACGATPVNGLLLCARGRGLRPRLLDLRNSGDTAGDRSRVVGYASFAFGASSR
ncbi:MAG: AmmeMemoRadiSam system protein B [Betaproteobacteria bacterium]|nr:AmmeMemoRadiSam system protein B [Betaproteobacteria bacterium]